MTTAMGRAVRLLAGSGSTREAVIGRAVVAAVLVGSIAAAITWSRSPSPPTTAALAQASGRSFMAAYMNPDGRIVRRDQGADTVSEGQAYGLLTAIATGDAKDFQTIWSWTEQHLSRPDGLLAWHWQDGRVQDPTPAADADLDTAWALDLASTRFGEPELAKDADRMADSILREETVPTPLGLVLVAGPWARNPALVEPGYLSPEAFQALGRLTGDRRWAELDSTTERIASEFTSKRELVPDWVSISTSGSLSAASGPGSSSSTPSFGLDSARLTAWTSVCSAPLRKVAVSEWPVLRGSAERRQFAISLGESGVPVSGYSNAAIAVADAAAAFASGDSGQSRALIHAAEVLNHRFSTYYGSAWLALWQSLITNRLQHSC